MRMIATRLGGFAADGRRGGLAAASAWAASGPILVRAGRTARDRVIRPAPVRRNGGQSTQRAPYPGRPGHPENHATRPARPGRRDGGGPPLPCPGRRLRRRAHAVPRRADLVAAARSDARRRPAAHHSPRAATADPCRGAAAGDCVVVGPGAEVEAVPAPRARPRRPGRRRRRRGRGPRHRPGGRPRRRRPPPRGRAARAIPAMPPTADLLQAFGGLRFPGARRLAAVAAADPPLERHAPAPATTTSRSSAASAAC